jgi:hypothetical protein
MTQHAGAPLSFCADTRRANLPFSTGESERTKLIPFGHVNGAWYSALQLLYFNPETDRLPG